MPKFSIAGKVYRDGNLVSSFDLTADTPHLDYTERTAWQLLQSYMTSLIIQGGTATFEKTCDEFRVAMPDGSAEYIKLPVEVKALNDPTMSCCGRDAADCDCEEPKP